MSVFDDFTDVEVDSMVLGAVIGVGSMDLVRVFELEATYFSHPAAEKIFDRLVELRIWDVATLLGSFKNDSQIQEFIHYCYTLYGMQQRMLEAWIPVLFDRAMLREIRLVGLANSEAKDVSEALERIKVLQHKVTVFAGGVLPDRVADMIKALDSIRNPIVKVPTVYPKLNQLITGLRPGGLYVIGARPSVGKTLVGLQLAWGLAKKNVGVAFFSLEMTKDDLYQRIYSQELDIPLSRMENNSMTDLEGRVIESFIENTDAPFYVEERAFSITQIWGFVERAKRKIDLRAVFIDYLQIVPATGKDKRDEVSKVSQQLKQMAKELGVSVVALAQLNRRTDGDEPPALTDLKESGQIEQDADVVLLLHREQSDLDKQNDNDNMRNGGVPSYTKSIMSMHIAKNRHGRVGLFKMTVLGDYARLGVY